jgi:hypothetical protein
MKLTLVVRADLGLGRGKIAAQAAHAAVVSVLANLGPSTDFRAWLRDGSLPSRPGPHRLPKFSIERISYANHEQQPPHGVAA